MNLSETYPAVFVILGLLWLMAIWWIGLERTGLKKLAIALSKEKDGTYATALASKLNFKQLVFTSNGGLREDLRDLNVDDLLRELPKSRTVVEQFPSVFTAVGILFTFVGLVTGIESIDPSATAADIQSSIGALVQGLSTAFISSIVGIVLSLLSLLFAKLQLASLDREFSHLQAILNERDENRARARAVQTEILQLPNRFGEIRTSLRDQSESLRTLVSDLPAQITRAMQPHFSSLEGAVNDMGRKAHATHSEMLESVMDNFMSNFNGAISRQFEQLGIVLQQSIEMHRAAEEKYARVLQDLHTTGQLLMDLTTAQSNTIVAQREQFQSLTTLAGELGAEIKGLTSEIQQGEEERIQLGRQLERVSSEMVITMDRYSQQSDLQSNLMRDGLDVLTTENSRLGILFSDFQKEIRASENVVVTNLSQSLQAFDKALEEAMNHFGGTLVTMSHRSRELEQSVDGLRAAVTALNSQTQRLVGE